MKKLSLYIFFLSFFVIAWGISFDESLERFEGWIALPLDQSNQIFEAINDISVYRKYRLAMIGPIRDDERFYDVNKLLELVFDSIKTGEINEDLSLSAYLAYLSAHLFNRDLTVGGLNSFAPYYTTYNQANNHLRDTAIQYFSHWIAHGVGIVAAPPDARFSIDPPAKALKTRLRYAFTPDETLFPLIVSGFTSETEENLKQAIARVKAETAIFLKKWRALILTLLILFEAFVQYHTQGYLFSDSEAFVYGLLTFSLLGFSLLVWLSRVSNKKRRGAYEWTHLWMYLAIGALWFFPYWVAPEALRMDRQETFYQSAVYEVLKEELFEWKRGLYEEAFNEYLISREATPRFTEILRGRLNKAMPFSGIKLREETESYLLSKWKSARFLPLETSVMQAYSEASRSDFRSPNFYLFQSVEGSFALLLITLATATLVLLRSKRRVVLAIYACSWIPFFAMLFRSDIHLLVEKGYPVLPLTENHPGMFVLVLAITCFLFSIYLSWKTYQKEGKKQ